MTQRASLLFRFPPPTARAVAAALAPETGTDVPKTASHVSLEADAHGSAVRVEVEAEDLSSLRAAVNSYLRWVDAAARAAALGQR